MQRASWSGMTRRRYEKSTQRRVQTHFHDGLASNRLLSRWRPRFSNPIRIRWAHGIVRASAFSDAERELRGLHSSETRGDSPAETRGDSCACIALRLVETHVRGFAPSRRATCHPVQWAIRH